MKNKSQNRPVITLKKIVHRRQKQLFVIFKYFEPFIVVLRNHPSFKWSKTHKGWYTIYSSTSVSLISNIFPKVVLNIDASITPKLVQNLNTKEQKTIANNNDIIFLFSKYLKGRKYSETNIKTHITIITGSINHIANKPLNELTNKDVEFFIKEVVVPKKMSVSSQKQLINAMMLFKAFYPECNINKVQLQELKQTKILPTF